MPEQQGGLMGAVIFMVFAFYLLSSTYVPMEAAALDLQVSLGGDITGESLGTANVYGNFSGTVANPAIEPGSETVYANGTASASWVNATVAVTDGTGGIVIVATGPGNSTSSAVITIDYNNNPGIENIESMSSIPGVVVLLFILSVLFGIMLTGGKSVGI